MALLIGLEKVMKDGGGPGYKKEIVKNMVNEYFRYLEI